jgi:uncharacterized repeat protein (TIGR01451 family)
VADAAGDVLHYTVRVTNEGNVALTNVTVTDPLTGQNVSGVTLAPGASQTYNTSYVLKQSDLDNNGGGDGDIDNTATATATQTGPVSDSTFVPLVFNPGIELVKTAGNIVDANNDGRVDPGDTITYSFVVTNTGNITLNAVNPGDSSLGLPITLNQTTLAPGAVATGSVDYTLTAADFLAGSKTNTATAIGSTLMGGTVTAQGTVVVSLQVPPVADLSLTKTDGASTYTPDGSTTYTIVVTNNGPSFVTGATVTDTLPAAITSATWTVNYTGMGSSGPVSGSGDISASVNLAVGGTATFTVVATISSTATDNLVNTASVTVPAGTTDPNLANNSASVTLTPQQADLALTKTASTSITFVDEPITFSFVINNKGPNTATDVRVSDPFPAGLQYLSNAVPSQGTYDPTTGIWFVGTMPSGTSAALQVTALVVLPGPIVNTAMVGADQFDPDLSDQISSTTVLAQLPPDQVGKGPFLTPNAGLPSIIPTSLPPPIPGAQALIAVGADAGNLPLVQVFNRATGQMLFSFMPFPSFFRGGVRVTLGDVNGDGVPDIIAAAGPGGGPEVVVFDGRSGQMLSNFYATAPFFTGGVNVAAGDVNGDGRADIVIGAGPGGGPQVTVFDGRTFQALTSFYATAPFFRGGVNVATGDINGDGRADILTGFGPGGGPQVAVFDGRTFQELSSFYALSPFFRGGLFVAAGDVNGDGRDDIIVGAGAGGGPQVTVFDGRRLQSLSSFFATNPSSTAGVRVASADLSGNDRDAIITAFGTGHLPDVRSFDLVGRLLDDYFAFAPTFSGGVNLAAVR